jgi:predicted acyltransferase
VEDGAVVFSPRYRYTWIVSSLNFVVTVMTGMFAGYILRDGNRSENRKVLLLVGLGAAMTLAGWLWGLQMPVIKKIWTSSMTLVSSGYCFMLMGLFYWWIDVKGHNRHTGLLKVYGMNSIMAYMLAQTINFSSVGRSLFHGLEQYLGEWYGVLIALSNVAIAFAILGWMYRKKIYLRV